MPVKQFAPRLHIVLASASPLAVVFRRGPSKHVCTLLWDRSCDFFSMGQWLKGRIYERRSDLSPDGKYLIYFAMNGKWKSEAKGSWTAISRAPYLKALVMLPKGDCWHGGGLFTGESKYWLNDGHGHAWLRNSSEVQPDTKFVPAEQCGGECPGVYYPRLIRDGWSFLECKQIGHWHDVNVFQKPAGNGWLLRKLAHGQVGAGPGRGCYWDEHVLISENSSDVMRLPSWTWAEVDRNRLIWCTEGKLFAGQLKQTGFQDISELYDFNYMSFAALPAPY